MNNKSKIIKYTTYLEELPVWLVRALRLILGLLLTTDSSPSFTAEADKGRRKGNMCLTNAELIISILHMYTETQITFSVNCSWFSSGGNTSLCSVLGHAPRK